MKRLGVIKEDIDYCYQVIPSAPWMQIGCNGDKYVKYIWSTSYYSLERLLCFLNNTTTDACGAILSQIRSEDLQSPIIVESFDAPTIDAFLTLRFLQAADIFVRVPLKDSAGGSLPLQLAGLTDLKILSIRYTCLPRTTLPTAWQWPNLLILLVGVVQPPRLSGLDVYHPPMPPGCGILGPLPAGWPQQMPQLKQLYLVNNALEGTLPRSVGRWTKLKVLMLHQNKFLGIIPTALARLPLTTLVVRDNKLSGGLPSFDGHDGSSPLQRSLETLDLSQNALTGKPRQV